MQILLPTPLSLVSSELDCIKQAEGGGVFYGTNNCSILMTALDFYEMRSLEHH